MKRVLIISGVVVIAALIIAAGIYLRTRRPAPAAQPSPAAGVPGGLPSAGEIPGSTGAGGGASTGTSAEISINKPALGYVVLPSGEIRYVQPDGQVVRLTSVSSTVLSTTKISDVLDAKFSFDGRKVLVKAGDSTYIRWSVYDIDKNSWRQLSIDAADANWSPRDYRIAYFARRVSSASLTLFDLSFNSSRPRTLLTLNGEDLTVSWAGSQRLLFGEKASAYVPGNLWKYDLQNGALSLLREASPGMSVSWGNGDSGILFTGRASSRGGTLSLINKDGVELQTFSFTTLASKCNFFTVGTSTLERIVCAVPRDTRSFSLAALPDDYFKGVLNTVDSFYVVDPRAGSLTPLPAATALGADASQISVRNNRVYFINKADGKLYGANLGN